MILTVSDARAAGYCVAGIKQWCATHSLDWKNFVRNGIDSKEAMRLDPGLAQNVMDAAKRRSNDGR